MHRCFINIATLATVLLLSANLSLAEDKKSEAAAVSAETTKPDNLGAKAAKPAKTKKVKKAKAKAIDPTKLVDLNKADKAALMKLPGVSDAVADKIIAGRPYNSKADLVTKAGLGMDVYESIRKLVILR